LIEGNKSHSIIDQPKAEMIAWEDEEEGEMKVMRVKRNLRKRGEEEERCEEQKKIQKRGRMRLKMEFVCLHRQWQ
jgi:hypothetical protein